MVYGLIWLETPGANAQQLAHAMQFQVRAYHQTVLAVMVRPRLCGESHGRWRKSF